jgi:putative membrane protein
MGKLIFVAVFSMALAIFAFENTAPVHVRFLFWQSHDVPLALLIILTAAFGTLVTLIATFPGYHRRNRELARHKRELEDLREKVL